MDWVIEELANLSLGDKRLNKRAEKLVAKLSRNASQSLPSACGGWSETKAAYRFFDNERVESEKIDESHLKATLLRMSQEKVVLIPQDTTVLNFSKQFERKDTGPTIRDATKGMYLHCALAVTPQKVCMGVVSSTQWYREALQKLSKKARRQKNYTTPIEKKESYRWLENYHRANEYAAQLPNTLIVSIADREGDIYDIYEEAQEVFSKAETKAHYLIRAKTDRKLCTPEDEVNEHKIKSRLRSDAPLGQLVIHVSATQKRKARDAHMTVYAKHVAIALPDKRKKEPSYTPVKVTAILCVELHPPVGCDTIEWLLLTDLSVATFEEACEKIHWYTCRWQIEIFFKILKSGCTIEKLQLTDKNFRACLSFYKIIAWRILYLVIIGRECPDLSCECVFSKEEWQTTYVVVRRKKPPALVPSLNEMIRMIASLGGYLNRKSDPEPGVKTMWLGLKNLQEHIKAKEAFEAVYGRTCG